MGFNPYANLAKIADITGSKDVAAAARVGDRTQRRVQQTGGRLARTTGGTISHAGDAVAKGFNAHPTRGAIAGRGTPSLPGIRTKGGVTGQGVNMPRAERDGVTIEEPYIAAVGMPSIRVTANSDGSVQTTKAYLSAYTPFISAPDWNRMKSVVRKIKRRAEMLSKGRLTLKRLRQLNHPYGKGLYKAGSEGLTGRALKRRKRRGLGRLTRLKGVSNMAVVNVQSGEFQRSWATQIKLVKAVGRAVGVIIVLANLSEHAAYLLGTKTMRAHGPFLTAVQLYKPELDRIWREITRRAWQKMKQLKAAAQRRGEPFRIPDVGALVI
jgi:hypothetical protein